MAIATPSSANYYTDPAFAGDLVGRAPTWEAFEAAVTKGTHGSVLHTTENWEAERQAFLNAYEQWDRPTPAPAESNLTLVIEGDGTHRIAGGKMGIFPEIFEMELLKIALTYARLTGEDMVLGLIQENLYFDPKHNPHATPVLNRTLFAPGTVLKKERDRIIGVAPEGDYLFMQPGMYHHSSYQDPNAPGPRRISLIAYSFRV